MKNYFTKFFIPVLLIIGINLTAIGQDKKEKKIKIIKKTDSKELIIDTVIVSDHHSGSDKSFYWIMDDDSLVFRSISKLNEDDSVVTKLIRIDSDSDEGGKVIILSDEGGKVDIKELKSGIFSSKNRKYEILEVEGDADHVFVTNDGGKVVLKKGKNIRLDDGEFEYTLDVMVESDHDDEQVITAHIGHDGSKRSMVVIVTEAGNFKISEPDDEEKTQLQEWNKEAGLNELNPEEMKFFPNPVSDYLNVEFRLKEEGQVFLTLFDSSGREVRKEKLHPEGGWYKTGFDISDLESGIYFLMISQQGKSTSKKVVISK